MKIRLAEKDQEQKEALKEQREEMLKDISYTVVRHTGLSTCTLPTSNNIYMTCTIHIWKKGICRAS